MWIKSEPTRHRVTKQLAPGNLDIGSLHPKSRGARRGRRNARPLGVEDGSIMANGSLAVGSLEVAQAQDVRRKVYGFDKYFARYTPPQRVRPACVSPSPFAHYRDDNEWLTTNMSNNMNLASFASPRLSPNSRKQVTGKVSSRQLGQTATFDY